MDLKSGDLFLGVVVDLSLRRTSFGCLLAQSSILGGSGGADGDQPGAAAFGDSSSHRSRRTVGDFHRGDGDGHV